MIDTLRTLINLFSMSLLFSVSSERCWIFLEVLDLRVGFREEFLREVCNFVMLAPFLLEISMRSFKLLFTSKLSFCGLKERLSIHFTSWIERSSSMRFLAKSFSCLDFSASLSCLILVSNFESLVPTMIFLSSSLRIKVRRAEVGITCWYFGHLPDPQRNYWPYKNKGWEFHERRVGSLQKEN